MPYWRVEHPTLTPQQRSHLPMTFLLWNVRGLGSRISEIREILKKKSIDVFSLLETEVRQPNRNSVAQMHE